MFSTVNEARVAGFAYVVITAVAILAPRFHERAFLIAQPALFGATEDRHR